MKTRYRDTFRPPSDTQFISQHFQAQHVLAVVLQQDFQQRYIATALVIPPEPDCHPAVDAGGLSPDAELSFDSLQTAVEVVPPTIVHEVAVDAALGEIETELGFDVGEIEARA